MLKAWSLILMLWLPLVAAAESDALALLESMSQASKELNYKGVFSYQTGRTLQSVRIYHRSDDVVGEVERLISLNGAAREVIRNNDTVTCINPEGNQVNISQRPLGRGFPSDLPRRLRSAMPFYDVELGGKVRVAGRSAQEVFIKPIDDYRYGYRLWVDKETHLLLKSELLSDDGQVLETFAFSDLEVNIAISDDSLAPGISGSEMVTHRSNANVEQDDDSDTAAQWRTGWLPEGFTLVASQSRSRANNGAYVEQRVFSDGLSSVSIFIEKIRAHHRHLHGSTQMGAVNAYGKIIHAHFITVVGEIPAATVDKIGEQIKFSGTQQP